MRTARTALAGFPGGQRCRGRAARSKPRRVVAALACSRCSNTERDERNLPRFTKRECGKYCSFVRSRVRAVQLWCRTRAPPRAPARAPAHATRARAHSARRARTPRATLSLARVLLAHATRARAHSARHALARSRRAPSNP